MVKYASLHTDDYPPLIIDRDRLSLSPYFTSLFEKKDVSEVFVDVDRKELQWFLTTLIDTERTWFSQDHEATYNKLTKTFEESDHPGISIKVQHRTFVSSLNTLNQSPYIANMINWNKDKARDIIELFEDPEVFEHFLSYMRNSCHSIPHDFMVYNNVFCIVLEPTPIGKYYDVSREETNDNRLGPLTEQEMSGPMSLYTTHVPVCTFNRTKYVRHSLMRLITWKTKLTEPSTSVRLSIDTEKHGLVRGIRLWAEPTAGKASLNDIEKISVVLRDNEDQTSLVQSIQTNVRPGQAIKTLMNIFFDSDTRMYRKHKNEDNILFIPLLILTDLQGTQFPDLSLKRSIDLIIDFKKPYKAKILYRIHYPLLRDEYNRFKIGEFEMLRLSYHSLTREFKTNPQSSYEPIELPLNACHATCLFLRIKGYPKNRGEFFGNLEFACIKNSEGKTLYHIDTETRDLELSECTAWGRVLTPAPSIGADFTLDCNNLNSPTCLSNPKVYKHNAMCFALMPISEQPSGHIEIENDSKIVIKPCSGFTHIVITATVVVADVWTIREGGIDQHMELSQSPFPDR